MTTTTNNDQVGSSLMPTPKSLADYMMLPQKSPETLIAGIKMVEDFSRQMTADAAAAAKHLAESKALIARATKNQDSLQVMMDKNKVLDAKLKEATEGKSKLEQFLVAARAATQQALGQMVEFKKRATAAEAASADSLDQMQRATEARNKALAQTKLAKQARGAAERDAQDKARAIAAITKELGKTKQLLAAATAEARQTAERLARVEGDQRLLGEASLTHANRLERELNDLKTDLCGSERERKHLADLVDGRGLSELEPRAFEQFSLKSKMLQDAVVAERVRRQVRDAVQTAVQSVTAAAETKCQGQVLKAVAEIKSQHAVEIAQAVAQTAKSTQAVEAVDALCIYCCERPRDCVPQCGHLSGCITCLAKLKSCAVCRAPIKARIKVIVS